MICLLIPVCSGSNLADFLEKTLAKFKYLARIEFFQLATKLFKFFRIDRFLSLALGSESWYVSRKPQYFHPMPY